MASLVARDLNRRRLRKRWSLERRLQLPLGSGVERDQILTDWDAKIAARHAAILWDGENLRVVKSRDHSGASRPIFYNGQDLDEFELVPGEGFVIGRTVFQFEPAWMEPSSGEKPRLGEQFTHPSQLRTMLDPNAEELQAIGRLLQIPLAKHEQIERQVLAELRAALPQADLAALVQLHDNHLTFLASEGDLGICEPLLRKACELQEIAEARWRDGEPHEFPPVPGAKWALCVPVICETGTYALYLSGKRLHRGQSTSICGLHDHQRAFVQIMGDIAQSARSLSELAECRDDMQQFFPQEIRNLLRQYGPNAAFRTATTRAAILFCDLRGSSRFAEQQAENLSAAWERIRAALGIMTGAITGQNGCIGDFQGDAAMAFWGWPRKESSTVRLSEDVTHACQAADKLREGFLNTARDAGPLTGFECGIGIAAGDVVAGMLGTVEQRKIGVFGPAVNLAARLESMTKQWGVSILIDGVAVQALQEATTQRASHLADRLRFLADVTPVGTDAAVSVFELLPPPADATLPRNLIRRFERGRKAFANGSWDEALSQLRRVDEAGDGPSKFLIKQMERLQRPPAGWQGVIQLERK